MVDISGLIGKVARGPRVYKNIEDYSISGTVMGAYIVSETEGTYLRLVLLLKDKSLSDIDHRKATILD